MLTWLDLNPTCGLVVRKERATLVEKGYLARANGVTILGKNGIYIWHGHLWTQRKVSESPPGYMV